MPELTWNLAQIVVGCKAQADISLDVSVNTNPNI